MSAATRARLVITSLLALSACSRTDLGDVVTVLDAGDTGEEQSIDAAQDIGPPVPDDSCDAGPDVWLLLSDAEPPAYWYDSDGGLIVSYRVSCCGGRICQGFCGEDGGCYCGAVPSSCTPLKCCIGTGHAGGPACESCLGGN